jgi:hypothetical protein
MADPFELGSAFLRPKRGYAAARAQSPRDYSTGSESRAIGTLWPGRSRYPEPVILDFVLGLAALAAVWISATRWSAGYKALFGRRPPNGWMFSRVDDSGLERDRRVLLVILGIAVVIAVSILSRSYPT